MFNWQVIGHENVLEFLETSIQKEKLANAYLFYGPEHLGKNLVAKEFVKILFCIDAVRPCGKCANCRQIDNSIHPDIFIIKKETDAKNISIEQTRQMQERLSQGSFLNSYKFGIIEDAELLNDNGWNSILKLLEEPAMKTVIILLANKVDKIPATIISRCQKLQFKSVAEDKIYKELLTHGVSRDKALEIVRFSDGKIGLAKTMAQDSGRMENYHEIIKKCLDLFNADKGLKEKNLLIDELVKKENNAKIFNLIAVLLRDLIMVKVDTDLVRNLKFSGELTKISLAFEIKKLKDILVRLLTYQEYLKNNVSGKLLLENLIVEFFVGRDAN